jgi:hypothetical protein
MTKKAEKAAQLVGFLIIVASVIAYVGGEDRLSILGFLVGAVVYGAGRFAAWWRHG